jgi:hypothetical protein
MGASIAIAPACLRRERAGTAYVGAPGEGKERQRTEHHDGGDDDGDDDGSVQSPTSCHHVAKRGPRVGGTTGEEPQTSIYPLHDVGYNDRGRLPEPR